ncbi:MAG: IPT/TIG domain-containing protein, partial [Bdellovibrionota bacterium]
MWNIARPPQASRVPVFFALALVSLGGCRVSGDVTEPSPELTENAPPVAVDWTSSVSPSPSPEPESASSSSAAAVVVIITPIIITPTLTSVSPAVGAIAGGATLTLSGSGFSNDSRIQVSVVGVPCTSITAASDATLTCVAGAATAAGLGTVIVTRSDTGTASLANGFTYEANLKLDSVAPSNGRMAGGTSLTLTGARFATGMLITVDGAACASVSVA